MYKTILWIREYADEIKRGLIGGFTIFGLATIFFTTDSSIESNNNTCLKWKYNNYEKIYVCSIYKTAESHTIPYGSIISSDSK
ncbi:hypothetical protein [Gottfriedia solisilvae]|uniref:Uncharacterized protein n=1 Tax=Gottfriedia solisilvae TaxID=1516104 RepID=A0A8J3AGD5_9BACI|nr:hypothetical protein [Gottfriedia solisilvae]GGI13843.1 hypothetical protein GCM10007380_19940 [Gottfriedia solisilvae]